MARPTKLTPQVQDVIVEALKLGLYADQAATLADISEFTYYNWIKRGEAEQARIDNGETPDPNETIYVEFSKAVKKASVQGQADALSRVREGDKGWQGSAWFLERRDRQRWAQTVKVVEDESAVDEWIDSRLGL